MKKIHFLLLFLLPALIVSCQKEEDLAIPDGKVRIDIRASVGGVFENLTDTAGLPCFNGALPAGYKFRVGAFLYGPEGDYANKLIDHQVVLLDDAGAVANFRMEPAPGEYRVMATVDVVRMEGDSVVYKYNDIVLYLEEAKINIQYKNPGGYYNAVGCTASGLVSLKESGGNANVSLQVKPVGSLLTFRFRQMGPEKNQPLTFSFPGSYQYQVAYYPVANDFFYDVSAKMALNYLAPPLPDVVWQQVYLLPTEDPVEFSWASGSLNGSGKVDCRAGENKFVDVDVQTGQVQVSDKAGR